MTHARIRAAGVRRALLALVAIAMLCLLDARALRADDGGATATLAQTFSDSKAHADRAADFTLGHDYDLARAELAKGDPNDPSILLERGRVALYEADCDSALVTLSHPDVAKTQGGAFLGDIARGCARVTAALAGDVDTVNAIEIRYQDERDRALTPLMIETIVKARDALTRDLGVSWPKPTRIIVVRDLLSLSAMTGLPYKSAQTTGTVAVAKWGRVTLLSPRASHHGYGWRDTIAHELTHLAVTRATQDRAPLWLQEGVAKRQEVRWREPGPFDDRPTPDAIVMRGMELKLDLALDKLGPSIAMLPSADAAMVAFAEVTSFVRFYANNAGVDALPNLFRELRDGKDVDTSLRDASGADLRGWDVKWRGFLASKPREPLPPLFGLGGDASAGDMRDLRERVRLAELLLGRDHAAQALLELDRIKSSAALDDPSVRYLRARVLEALGRSRDADPLVADAKAILSSYGPWWAIRGRFARARGDDPTAGSSFFEAVASDPLDVEAACEGLAADALPRDLAAKPLCDAARGRAEPSIGRD
jgi:hypothetical protein